MALNMPTAKFQPFGTQEPMRYTDLRDLLVHVSVNWVTWLPIYIIVGLHNQIACNVFHVQPLYERMQVCH